MSVNAAQALMNKANRIMSGEAKMDALEAAHPGSRGRAELAKRPYYQQVIAAALMEMLSTKPNETSRRYAIWNLASLWVHGDPEVQRRARIAMNMCGVEPTSVNRHGRSIYRKLSQKEYAALVVQPGALFG